MGKSKKEKKKQDYVTKDSAVIEDGFKRKITEDAEVIDNSAEASQSKRKKMKREKNDEDKPVDVGDTNKVKRKKKKDKLERTDLSQPTLPNLTSECVPNNLRQIVRNTLGLPVEDLTEHHKSQNEIKKDENFNNSLLEEIPSKKKKIKTEKSKDEYPVLTVTDITQHSSSSSKLGPLLPCFSHAPCSPSILAASSPSVIIHTQWKGNWPTPSISLNVEGRHQYECNPTKQTMYTTFLAQVDSLTGHTKLIEACPLVLHPKVSYPESLNPLLNSDHKTAETREEKMVEQKHLIKTFGRVQGVKFFEKKDSLKVEANQTEEKIMLAADNVKVDLLAPEPTQQPVDILPPRHDLAATKEQVYLVSDILSILEMKQLEEAGERVLAECRDKTETDRMVKTRLLSRLGGYLLYGCATTRRDPGHKPAILLYMEGIIKFSRLRPGDLAKGPNILQEFLPPSIGKKIFDTFSDGSRGAGNRLITPELRDKALCYVIVLALLAGDFSIEMNLLSESVLAKSDHLKKLVAMVGAHMVSDTQKMAQFITLKLPLATFNINYVGTKKKGRKN